MTIPPPAALAWIAGHDTGLSSKAIWNGYVVRVGSRYVTQHGGWEAPLGSLVEARVISQHAEALQCARLFRGAVWSYGRAANGGFRAESEAGW